MRIATDHREAILHNAARLFARKPFHEVLMDDVAVQTGIAKGTIYRYFPNKAELFVALSMRFVEMLGEEVERTIASNDPVVNMRAMLVRLVMSRTLATSSDWSGSSYGWPRHRQRA